MTILSEQNSPKAILQDYFGYTTFREHQEEIIQHLISGRDAFALMPTGSGKSLCYQIPGMIREGVGIVISPLIALMQDQVDALRQIGIRADFLNSSLTHEEAYQVSQRVLAGGTDLLYVAPERLLTPGFQRLLYQARIALFAIDEAHCVSQWGHDFRPEYLNIAVLLEQFPDAPRIALTATADAVTRKEILGRLCLRHPGQFISSFDRPNICYRVELKQNEKKQLIHFLQTEHSGDSGIVYCLSRKKVDAMAKWLSGRGFAALPYHAGMDSHSRLNHQRRFLQGEGVIIVATVAFGMGIDKPDVRFVAHSGMPKNMETYYQETGRAGRDGQPADAWMVYSLADVVALRRMLEDSAGNAQFKMVQQRKTESMLGFCETTRCRRQVLLSYFGEELPQPCGNCDTCRGNVETWNGTVAAQKAISCVYRTGQRFGAEYLSDVLLGKENERIQRFGHDKVSTFGIGGELSKKEWKSVYRQLVAAGLLSVDMESKGGFFFSQKTWTFLKGKQTIQFRKDPAPLKKERRFRAEGKQKKSHFSDPSAMMLWEKLRSLRLEIAKKKSIPPYVIFHDTTLKELVTALPRSLGEMRGIYGIGRKKLGLYGKAFLEIIEQHIQEHGISEHPPENPGASGSANDSADDVSHTVYETLHLFKKGMMPEEIAGHRGLSLTTIYTHFSKAIEENALSVDEIVPLEREEILEIENAFRFQPAEENGALKPIFERFQEKYDYGLLRCVCAGMVETEENKSYDVGNIRKVFPNAYKGWTEADDERLKAEYLKGENIEALTEMFQRKPGAIRSRLKKLAISGLSHNESSCNAGDTQKAFPNANKGWTAADDDRLKAEYLKGESIEALAEMFYQKPGVIHSRLKKLEFSNTQKQIVCLANSRKYSGYCVAGKTVSDNGIGEWIRPVSDTENGELSINSIILDNGKIPRLLDIITVSLAEYASHSYQTENYAMGNQYWSRAGELPVSDLPGLCDDVGTLWLNGYHSQHGVNDRIPEEITNETVSSSLVFIKPDNAHISVREESHKKKIRAKFHFKGIAYCLVVTDPVTEGRYYGEKTGEYPLDNVFFTVSLGEPYNEYCYKLVAGVIHSSQ